MPARLAAAQARSGNRALASPDAFAFLVHAYPSDLVVVRLEDERDVGLERDAVKGVLMVGVGEQKFEIVGCGVLADVECEVMNKTVAETAEAEIPRLRLVEVVVKVERDSEPAAVLAKEEVVDVRWRLDDGVREHVA
jgi:hypothetical protein